MSNDLTKFEGKDGRKLQLTKKQLRVVECYLYENMSDEEIALDAGYASGRSGVEAVRKCMRKPHVQEYAMELAKQQLGSTVMLKSVKVLEALLTSKSDRVRMETAQDLLDRVGARVPEKRHVHHTGGVSINIDLG